MKRFLTTLFLTLTFLVTFDIGAAGILNVLERSGKLGSLVRFFEYGRSVPGKHKIWLETLGQVDNPMEAGWIDQMLQAPVLRELPDGEIPSRKIQSYGMSFSANILHAALDRDSSLAWDMHAAPAAPPNSVFYVARSDRQNREPGDVVVMAFLSSSLSGMYSFSNRTLNFEQPIPFTYPIYADVGDDLIATYPIVSTLDDEMDQTLSGIWQDQLSSHDASYSDFAFAWPFLDRSPFFRLTRRAFATRAQSQSKMRIQAEHASDIQNTLRLFIRDFTAMTREDGQLPVIFLIQSREATDLNLLEMLQPTLKEYGVPYIATEDHFSPSDLSGFQGDGHYQPEIDDLFAQEFLKILSEHPTAP